MIGMKPLKIRLLLLSINKNELTDIFSYLDSYMNILPSQVPYVLENLKGLNFIYFNKESGQFSLTQLGSNYLNEWSLSGKRIEDIANINYTINSEFYSHYIL